LLHRDLPRLVDPADTGHPIPAGPGATIGNEPDPPCHLIIDRGRLVGLWEFDTETARIAYRLFVSEDSLAGKAIEDTEAFVRDQLGDARSFSLDSPKSRAPRVAALRST
jgi:hypothetical protein